MTGRDGLHFHIERSEEDCTVMRTGQKSALRLVPMLLKKGKEFDVRYVQGGVEVTVYEVNEIGGLFT